MKVFYHMDGNGVGAHILDLGLIGNIEEMDRAVENINGVMEAVGGLISKETVPDFLIIGGDDILTRFEWDKSLCEKVQEFFFQMTGLRIAIGAGRTPIEADLALDYSKLKGQDIVFFDECVYR